MALLRSRRVLLKEVPGHYPGQLAMLPIATLSWRLRSSERLLHHARTQAPRGLAGTQAVRGYTVVDHHFLLSCCCGGVPAAADKLQ